jgi:hypothetical protein
MLLMCHVVRQYHKIQYVANPNVSSPEAKMDLKRFHSILKMINQLLLGTCCAVLNKHKHEALL